MHGVSDGNSCRASSFPAVTSGGVTFDGSVAIDGADATSAATWGGVPGGGGVGPDAEAAPAPTRTATTTAAAAAGRRHLLAPATHRCYERRSRSSGRPQPATSW